MVQGIQKRVIVVKAPDPNLFEQAIFIMKESAFTQGVSAEQVLKEAQTAADKYVKGTRPMGKLAAVVPVPVWMMVGALVASAGWGVALFF